MFLCGSFGIQVDNCENSVESKTKENHFERIGLYPGGWLIYNSTVYRFENITIPQDSTTASLGLGSATITVGKGPGRSHTRLCLKK